MDYFGHLKIDGKSYIREQLLHSSNSFIKEWVSSSRTFKVQTSGTTGEPKEFTFLKSQAIASAKMTCEFFRLDKNTNALCCISTNFIGGKMFIVRGFVSGMNLILVEPSANPLKGIKERIDFVSLVPMQVYTILQDDETKEKLKTITNVLIGGAPLPVDLENKLAGFPNNIYLSFAMTETLSHVALRNISGANMSDYFEVLPNVSISTDTRDCLVINAPLLNDNPVITNDVVEIIDTKQFRWMGRFDDAINSGGIKIYPEVIEKKLHAIIPNHRYFISSVPDQKLGKKVILVIEGIELNEIPTVREKAKAVLTKYEIPKEYYAIGKFIETQTGKIKKRETLDMLLNI